MEAFRRPQVRGQVELCGLGIAGDDARGPGDARPLDDVESHPSTSNHGDGRSGLYPGDVEDGPDARRDTATGEASEVEGDVRVDLHELGLPNHRQLRERSRADHGRDRRAVERQARRAIGHAPIHVVRARFTPAVRDVARSAGVAAPTRPVQGDDDRVADRDASDVFPHLLHDARALVAEHHGRRGNRALSFEDVEIGATHARGRQAHYDLTGVGAVDL